MFCIPSWSRSAEAESSKLIAECLPASTLVRVCESKIQCLMTLPSLVRHAVAQSFKAAWSPFGSTAGARKTKIENTTYDTRGRACRVLASGLRRCSSFSFFVAVSPFFSSLILWWMWCLSSLYFYRACLGLACFGNFHWPSLRISLPQRIGSCLVPAVWTLQIRWQFAEAVWQLRAMPVRSSPAAASVLGANIALQSLRCCQLHPSLNLLPCTVRKQHSRKRLAEVHGEKTKLWIPHGRPSRPLWPSLVDLQPRVRDVMSRVVVSCWKSFR